MTMNIMTDSGGCPDTYHLSSTLTSPKHRCEVDHSPHKGPHTASKGLIEPIYWPNHPTGRHAKKDDSTR